MWGLYTNTTPLLSTRGPLSVALALTLSPIGERVGDSGGKWGDSTHGTILAPLPIIIFLPIDNKPRQLWTDTVPARPAPLAPAPVR